MSQMCLRALMGFEGLKIARLVRFNLESMKKFHEHHPNSDSQNFPKKSFTNAIRFFI